MPVTNTETIIDRQREAKLLSDDITVLKQQKEKEQREFGQWAEAKSHIIKEFGSLVDLDQTKDEINKSLILNLKKNKDDMVREIDALNVQRDNANANAVRAGENKITLLADVAVLTKAKKDLEDEIKSKRMSHNQVLDIQNAEAEVGGKAISKLREDKNTLEVDLKVMRGEFDIKRQFILDEEARLSIKSRDCAI